MNIGWLIIVTLVSALALYVIFRPRGRLVKMYGKRAKGESRRLVSLSSQNSSDQT